MSTKSSPGVSLRQAAEALGIPRKRLMKFIRDGMPVKRKSERIFVDLPVARNWIALNDLGADEKTVAPALDPSDPRHGERTAAAQIAHIKSGLKVGFLISRTTARDRYAKELGEFRQAFFGIPARLNPHAGQEANMRELEDGVTEALGVLQCDNPNSWPVQWQALRKMKPMPAVADVADEDRPRLPVLSVHDPRHTFNAAQASKREIDLAELAANVLTRSQVLDLCGRHCNTIRNKVRQIPTRVELADEGDLIRTINIELDAALVELSAIYASKESDHADQ